MLSRNSMLKVIVVMLVFTIFISSVSFATGPLYGVKKETKMTRKLLRGLLNIPFSVVEIPLEINEQVQTTDPFTGFFVGLGRGTAQAWKRCMVGIFDVVTFPIEVPENYNPISDPEFPMMDIVD